MFTRFSMLAGFVATTFLVAGGPAQAAQIFLKNGDRVSGQILSYKAGENLSIQTSFGRLSVPWATISAVNTGSGKPLLLSDSVTGHVPAPIQGGSRNADTPPARVIAAPAAVPPRPVSVVAAASPTPLPLEKEDQQAAKPANPEEYKWSGRVNFGGSLEDGNSNSKALIFDTNIKARNEKNRFTFGGEINWEQEEGEETENDQMAFGGYDRFLTDKWFVGLRQQFEKDKFEELELRSRTGLFSGYQFYERDDLNLQAKLGGDYIYEDFETGEREKDIAATWAFDYDQKFFDDLFQVFQMHELSVPVGDTGAFLFNSESGVRVPIGKYITGTAQVDFDWDNDPAEGVREEDTTYSFKIGYEW